MKQRRHNEIIISTSLCTSILYRYELVQTNVYLFRSRFNFKKPLALPNSTIFPRSAKRKLSKRKFFFVTKSLRRWYFSRTCRTILEENLRSSTPDSQNLEENFVFAISNCYSIAKPHPMKQLLAFLCTARKNTAPHIVDVNFIFVTPKRQTKAPVY